MKDYLIENLGIISHFLNTLTGGARFYTFSARTHYCAQILKRRKWVYIEKAIDGLLFFHPNHCEIEYYNEIREGKKPV
jgi:hypothetical protein